MTNGRPVKKNGLRGGLPSPVLPGSGPGGRRSASELSPASQPFLPAPGLPGTPFGPAPSITSQTIFTLHGANDGRLGPKAPACTGQTSWLRRKLRQRSGPVPGARYGVPGRQPQTRPAPHSPASGGKPAASRDGGVHASRIPPARSFTGGHRIRPVENRTVATRSPAEPRTGQAPPGDRRKRRCKSGVSSNRTRTVSSTVPGVTEPATRPARRAPACRAGRPPRAAPPEHRHRRGDRAARRRRRPGRAPSRCALPAAAPGPACSGRRLRAAVLKPAHARTGETRHPVATPYWSSGIFT